MTLDLATRQRKQAAQRELRAITKHENKARKAKRPPNPKADRGRVRDNGFLAYLRRQPCAISVAWPRWFDCEGRVQAAHIRTHKPGERPTGMQRKPDDCRATPLCAHHHAMQHSLNEMKFWAQYGLDPFEVAAQHFAAYQRER